MYNINQIAQADENFFASLPLPPHPLIHYSVLISFHHDEMLIEFGEFKRREWKFTMMVNFHFPDCDLNKNEIRKSFSLDEEEIPP